jgi:hypothetical protein
VTETATATMSVGARGRGRGAAGRSSECAVVAQITIPRSAIAAGSYKLNFPLYRDTRALNARNVRSRVRPSHAEVTHRVERLAIASRRANASTKRPGAEISSLSNSPRSGHPPLSRPDKVGCAGPWVLSPRTAPPRPAPPPDRPSNHLIYPPPGRARLAVWLARIMRGWRAPAEQHLAAISASRELCSIAARWRWPAPRPTSGR